MKLKTAMMPPLLSWYGRERLGKLHSYIVWLIFVERSHRPQATAAAVRMVGRSNGYINFGRWLNEARLSLTFRK